MLFLLLVGSLLLAGGGCSTNQSSSNWPPVPSVELTGTSNAPVTGYYVAKGGRVELSGVLPQTIRAPGLSQLAVRKLNSEDKLVLTARSRSGYASQTIRPKLDEGARVMLDSLSLSAIPPQELLALPTEALVVLTPYWYEGTWVFDDTSRGLQREPFVAGVPQIIDSLVKDIPDAREGFRLTFSAKPFAGFQQKLIWVRAEAGGNYYRLPDNTKQGWLCPAMFRYFGKTPKLLYLKAESKKS